MGFRKTKNYFTHDILMTAVIVATLTSFASVFAMWSPSDTSSMSIYISSPLKIAQFITHGILSIPALGLGVWFITLWRPNSTAPSAKNDQIMKAMIILWILSYLAGVIGYTLDYTPLLRIF